ncbi:hypothetical protein [Paraburkholderia sp. JHI869]|uniref:hypothetical protein n=1 Tax=Paraburkholderia sp. JHI869 TaxID=3112959 RepID=UPI00316D81C1
MSSKVPARSEQEDSTPLGDAFLPTFPQIPLNGHQPTNLASLPREEALGRARVAGHEILGDPNALQGVSEQLWLNWMTANIPVAVGQSDEEFGDLVDAMYDEFLEGLSEGVENFASNRTAGRLCGAGEDHVQ